MSLSWGGAVAWIPTDATAFFHRRARYYIEWDATWKNASEEKEVIAWIERFRVAMSPYVKGSYINAPDSGINDLRTHYGDNLARPRRSSASRTQSMSSTLSRALPQEGRALANKRQGGTNQQMPEGRRLISSALYQRQSNGL
jgi:hypothetical protein